MIKAFNTTCRPEMRPMALTALSVGNLSWSIAQRDPGKPSHLEYIEHIEYIAPYPQTISPCATLSVNAWNAPAKLCAGKFPYIRSCDSLLITIGDIYIHIWIGMPSSPEESTCDKDFEYRVL